MTYESDGGARASGVAKNLEKESELQDIVTAWPTLSNADRAAILAIVQPTEDTPLRIADRGQSGSTRALQIGSTSEQK